MKLAGQASPVPSVDMRHDVLKRHDRSTTVVRAISISSKQFSVLYPRKAFGRKALCWVLAQSWSGEERLDVCVEGCRDAQSWFALIWDRHRFGA